MRREMTLGLGLALSLAPISVAYAGDISASDAGARYGQAQSAAKFCPGGKVTVKAETLAKSYTGETAATFKSGAETVIAAWDKTFACIEIDPATNRQTQCRKMRLTSCRQAWVEIGSEGKDLPGLLDVDFSAWAEKYEDPK
jgi:hypothetical protein